MTWPEAIYHIIVEGGGGLLCAIVILALLTNFWEMVFDRRVIVKTRLPDAVVSDLRNLATEMRGYVASGDLRPFSVVAWAVRIERMLPVEEEDEEDDE